MNTQPDLQHLLQTAKNEPRNGQISFRIAKTYHKHQHHSTAIMYMFRALDCRAHRASYWTYMGQLFCEIKNYTAAKHYLRKALLKDPDYIPARFWLAAVYLEENDWTKFLQEYELIDEFEIHHVSSFPKPLLGLFCYMLSSGSPNEAGEPLPAGESVATWQRPPCTGW